MDHDLSIPHRLTRCIHKQPSPPCLCVPSDGDRQLSPGGRVPGPSAAAPEPGEGGPLAAGGARHGAAPAGQSDAPQTPQPAHGQWGPTGSAAVPVVTDRKSLHCL